MLQLWFVAAAMIVGAAPTAATGTAVGTASAVQPGVVLGDD